VETRRLAVGIDEALRGSGHGGKVDVRVLINEDTVGAKSFSLLVNTVKAGDDCLNAQEGALGHKHGIEHGMYCLSGRGAMVISGVKYNVKSGTAVFVPANEWHYVENHSTDEDLRYIIFYVPGGEEKEFLAKKK
jgi:mannose-6-phosphate isomerase-like protein (cupin superfamily)